MGADIEQGPSKRIALVAHDHKKDEIREWVRANRDRLARHRLVATGTTGEVLAREFDLQIGRPCDSGSRARDSGRGRRRASLLLR